MAGNKATADSKKVAKHLPEGYHTVTPFIITDKAGDLIIFLKDAFGGKVTYKLKDKNGEIMHATVKIGDSIIMLAETPENYKPVSCMLYLYVKDVDSTFKKSIKAGGRSQREPLDEFYGDRSACVTDNWGNTWWIATHLEDLDESEIKSGMRDTEKQLASKN